MAKYLINTIETYRVDNELEAKELIESTKKGTIGTLTKYSSTYKNQKQKGEVVQEWYRVTLTQEFADEKDPYDEIGVKYFKEGDFE